MINFSDLADETRAKAYDNPDYVYGNHFRIGRFAENDKPACIVGHALWNMGVSIDKLHEFDRGMACSIISVGRDTDMFEGDEEDLRWLQDVQYYQDHNVSWGESVNLADRDAKDRVLV